MSPSGNAAAVITAAGASRRMGGLKKEYRLLEGKPVLLSAVLPFFQTGIFRRIIVTCTPGHVSMVQDLLGRHIPTETLRIVEGGGTRQDSVRNALESLEAEAPFIVLIHDGARPWITPALIRSVWRSAEEFGACVPLVEVPEAVKQRDPSGLITTHFPRQTINFAQTPQGFHFDRILEAHRRALTDGAVCVDDAEVYALYCGPVTSVPGDPANRKITYAGDLPEEESQ